MKIALCFYGQPRKVTAGYEYFKKYFLDLYDVDVYAHLWDMEEAIEFKNLYNPTSITIEKQIPFEIPTNVFGMEQHHGESSFTRCAFNSISQAYSFYQVCNNRIKYSRENNITYNLIIKARTDTAIYSLDIDSIDIDMYNVPNQPSGFIYNDVIALCSEKTADVIGFKYEKLDQWYREGIRDFIPESLNFRALNENNIQIKQLNNTHINLIGR